MTQRKLRFVEILAVVLCSEIYVLLIYVAIATEEVGWAGHAVAGDLGGPIGIASLIVPFVIPVIKALASRSVERNWRLITRYILREGSLSYAVFWVSVGMWHVLSPVEPVYPTKEVAEFGQKTIAAIFEPGGFGPSGASGRMVNGFWADDLGMVVSVSRTLPTNNAIMVGSVAPSLPDGKKVQVASGLSVGPGIILRIDLQTRLIWAVSDHSPFVRRMHVFVSVQDTKSGKIIDRVVEEYATPRMQTNLPSAGEEIVLCAAELYQGDVAPIRVSRLGRVVAKSLDTSVSSRGIRLLTDIPYSEHLAGAPVFNLSKGVVGVVADIPGAQHCTLIPSRYMMELMPR